MDVGVGQGYPGEGDDPAVVHAAGDDGYHGARVRAGRAVDPEPPVGVEALAPGQPRQLGRVPGPRDHPTVGRGHQHRAGEDPGQLGGEVGQVAALQHHRHQRAVHLLAAGQHRRLLVEQLAEHLVEHVVEADPVRELDDREAPPVRLGQHRRRYRVEVAMQLDGQRREAAGVQLRDQADQRVGVVPQRVPRGEQQLVRLHPGQDVRHLHDVEPLDHPVQPAGSGEDPRAGQGRRAEDLAHSQPRTRQRLG